LVKKKKQNMEPPPYETQQHNLQHNLQCAVQALEISAATVQQLLRLQNFDIVFLIDDSGSMRSRVDGCRTRWDELKDTVQAVVQLATALDDDGIDLYFLNREGMRNVSEPQIVAQLFAQEPSGFTPLTDAFRRVLLEKLPNRNEKRLLVVIATDGEPNTDPPLDNVARFRAALAQRDLQKVFVQILACTDDEDSIGYLKAIDREIPNVDCCDDFNTERKEVQKLYPGRAFTRGDYVSKALLGPISKEWDNYAPAPRIPSCSPMCALL
jgi:hypothetical protein